MYVVEQTIASPARRAGVIEDEAGAERSFAALRALLERTLPV